MPALSITLNQLAAALLGAGAYIYHIKGSEWKACAVVCGCLIQRSNPDPYCAIAQVAQVLIDYEAQQAAQDLAVTPAARAAYRQAWAASEGKQVPARFAAAEAAAASAAPATMTCPDCAGDGCQWVMRPDGREQPGPRCPTCSGSGEVPATEATEWPGTIRTQHDNARTMQRLAGITGRASAAPAASDDEQPADPASTTTDDEVTMCDVCFGSGLWSEQPVTMCPNCYGTGEVCHR